MGRFLHHLRHPRRCYVVCAIARSGSNLLTDGLRSTRRAGRPKQFFLPKFEPGYASRTGLDLADYAGYVRGIIPATATANEVFGFKLMGWYLQSFLDRLRATAAFAAEGDDLAMLRKAFPRLRFVQIVRRDKVRQAISKARAAQTGLWKIRPGKQARGEAQYDPKLIASCLADTRREESIWEQFFARIGVTPHRVEYEDLCADYAGTIRAVLKFLQIRLPGETELRPVTIRQADPTSHEWEERFRALRLPNELAIT